LDDHDLVQIFRNFAPLRILGDLSLYAKAVVRLPLRY